jgi:RNA polymerase sigma-70 factor (ECF subfamily)
MLPKPHNLSVAPIQDIRELYSRYALSVHRLAYRITGSADDADDIVQDLFVGLPEALRSYDGRGSIEGWLRRIAARMSLALVHKRGRRSEVPLTESAGLQSKQPLPDAAVDRISIDEALAQLPASLRIVFVLKESEGYSHTEIGEILSIRPGTSEVRLHRAKQLLRAYLKRER